MVHSTWESVADEKNLGATKLVEKTVNGSTFVRTTFAGDTRCGNCRIPHRVSLLIRLRRGAPCTRSCEDNEIECLLDDVVCKTKDKYTKMGRVVRRLARDAKLQ